MAHNSKSMFFSMLEGMVEQEKVEKNYKPDPEYHDSLEAPFRAFHKVVETLKELPNFVAPDFENGVSFVMNDYDLDFRASLYGKYSIEVTAVRKARVDYHVRVSPESGSSRTFSGQDTDVDTFCYLLEKVFADFMSPKS